MVIVAGAGLIAGGAAISASKANSAAKQASADASATAANNNALTKEIYGENKATLSPFVQTGTNAGALLNDFYGIEQPTQTVQPAATAPAYGGFNFGSGSSFGGFYTPPNFTPTPTPAAAKPAVVEAPKPAAAKPAAATPPPVAAASKPAAANVGFAVQLGAFSNAAEANAMRDKLRAGGFSAFVEQVKTDKGVLNRVRVGPVASRADADKLKSQVSAKTGIDGMVRPHP